VFVYSESSGADVEGQLSASPPQTAIRASAQVLRCAETCRPSDGTVDDREFAAPVLRVDGRRRDEYPEGVDPGGASSRLGSPPWSRVSSDHGGPTR